jgi:hypothetical protein
MCWKRTLGHARHIDHFIPWRQDHPRYCMRVFDKSFRKNFRSHTTLSLSGDNHNIDKKLVSIISYRSKVRPMYAEFIGPGAICRPENVLGMKGPGIKQKAQKNREPRRLAVNKNGAPGWIRTTGLSLRRRTLYPTELREPVDCGF